MLHLFFAVLMLSNTATAMVTPRMKPLELKRDPVMAIVCQQLISGTDLICTRSMPYSEATKLKADMVTEWKIGLGNMLYLREPFLLPDTEPEYVELAKQRPW